MQPATIVEIPGQREKTSEETKSYIRHSMWGICLDKDFKGDFVIINETPLWISHILKHNTTKTITIKGIYSSKSFT